MNLLLVEDDTDVCAALKRIAKGYFDTIDEASSAYQAMVSIESRTPDAVITDWDLGGRVTGVDVANYATQKSPATKIVLITGKSMVALKSKTSHLSIDSYMEKPFSVAEFREVLELICSQ